MMRYLGPALRRLFKARPMDLTTRETDTIAATLGAAVDEHARVMDAEASDYHRRLRATMGAIDDVLQRLETSKNATG